jgi:hypothetical protein
LIWPSSSKTQKQKEVDRLAALAEKEARSYDRLYQPENLTRTTEVRGTADSSAAEEYEDEFF